MSYTFLWLLKIEVFGHGLPGPKNLKKNKKNGIGERVSHLPSKQEDRVQVPDTVFRLAQLVRAWV